MELARKTEAGPSRKTEQKETKVTKVRVGQASSLAIGVGTGDLAPPLPPNRTGGFPASGFLVSGAHFRELAACARTKAKEISPSSAK